MSLRSSGFWCDVCNEPMVSEMLLNTPIKSFRVGHFDAEFHYHEKCRPLLDRAIETEDPKTLPAGSPFGNALQQIKDHNAKYA